MKILKGKPRKGPNPKDFVKPKKVEMKCDTNTKKCNHTLPKKRKTTKEKKMEDRKCEQDEFLLFLEKEDKQEQ